MPIKEEDHQIFGFFRVYGSVCTEKTITLYERKTMNTFKFSIKKKIIDTVVGTGALEKVEIPAGSYEMTLFKLDGYQWLAYRKGRSWVGKTLGDWSAYVLVNPKETTLTSIDIAELALFKMQEMPA